MNRKVMPLFCLDLVQQVEHVRLDGDVERGDTLVGDDKLGSRHQRARDRNALALATGKSVRKTAQVFEVEAAHGRNFTHPRIGLLAARGKCP